jgi:biopolymer transport protein ExbB
MAIIFERFYNLRQHLVIPDQLLDEVLVLGQRKIPNADSIEKLKAHSALGEIIGAGLTAMQKPSSSEAEVRAQVEATGRRVAAQLERYLSALGSIASAAPLLGLFGTVVGMIEIFGSQAPGSGNPAQLAYGISVALYNTAFGLVIAIPSLVAWRFFRARVDHFVLELEINSERLVRHFFKSRQSG